MYTILVVAGLKKQYIYGTELIMLFDPLASWRALDIPETQIKLIIHYMMSLFQKIHGLWWLHILKGLYGYVWVNILTVSPPRAYGFWRMMELLTSMSILDAGPYCSAALGFSDLRNLHWLTLAIPENMSEWWREVSEHSEWVSEWVGEWWSEWVSEHSEWVSERVYIISLEAKGSNWLLFWVYR